MERLPLAFAVSALLVSGCAAEQEGVDDACASKCDELPADEFDRFQMSWSGTIGGQPAYYSSSFGVHNELTDRVRDYSFELTLEPTDTFQGLSLRNDMPNDPLVGWSHASYPSPGWGHHDFFLVALAELPEGAENTVLRGLEGNTLVAQLWPVCDENLEECAMGVFSSFFADHSDYDPGQPSGRPSRSFSVARQSVEIVKLDTTPDT